MVDAMRSTLTSVPRYELPFYAESGGETYVVAVYWMDSESLSNPVDHNDATEWCENGLLACVSAGILWFENENVIVLAQTFNEHEIDNLVKIDKRAVVRVVYSRKIRLP